MRIRTEKLVFFKISNTDDRIEDVISEFDVVKNLSETHMYPDDMPRDLYFLIEKEEQVIGFVALQNIKWYNRKSEITIVITPKFQRRGFGFQSLMFIMEFAFDQLNFHRLEAEVYDYNIASVQLLEKAGFSKEGVLREAKFSNGKYHNILRYGILRSEWDEKKAGLTNSISGVR
jgi:RimJ/RimL family protein N-acetyltransferase